MSSPNPLQASERFLNPRLVGALGVLVAVLVAGLAPYVSGAVVVNAPWTTGGSDARRTNFVPDALPVSPSIAWGFDRTETDPVVQGGRAYILGFDRDEWNVQDRSKIGLSAYAVDVHTGATIWERLLYAPGDPFLTNAGAHARLLSGLTLTSDLAIFFDVAGNVWALRLSSGDIAWKTKPGDSAFVSEDRGSISPLVVNNAVVVAISVNQGSYQDYRLFALEPATGAQRWSILIPRDTAGELLIEVAGLASDGDVILGVNPRRGVSAFEISTGALRWSKNIGADFSGATNYRVGPPTVAAGLAYVRVAAADARIIAYATADGSLRWNRLLTGSSEEVGNARGVAVHDTLLVAAAGNTVHGLDTSTGQTRWTHDLGGPSSAIPTITAEQVIVARERTAALNVHPYNGVIRALDRSDGHAVWSIREGKPSGTGQDRIPVAHGYLFARLGGVYAFGPDRAPPRWDGFISVRDVNESGERFAVLEWSAWEWNPKHATIERALGNGPWSAVATVPAYAYMGRYDGVWRIQGGEDASFAYRVRIEDHAGNLGAHSNIVYYQNSPSSRPVNGPRLGGPSTPVTPVHYRAWDTANLDDDCLYVRLAGATSSPTKANDLRLVPCRGHDAFTLVGSGESAELASDTDPRRHVEVRLAYADINSDGSYSSGDSLYLTTGASPTLASTTSRETFTLRLTSAGARAAGTFMAAGDTDSTSFGSAAPTLTGSFAWSDADASGGLASGDAVHVLPNTTAGANTGSGVPSNAVQLRGGPDAAPTPTPITTTGTPSPTPSGTPDPVQQATHFQVEAGSVAFDAVRGDRDTLVTVFARVVNPTNSTVSARVVFEAFDATGARVFVSKFPELFATRSAEAVRTSWLPDREGTHQVRAYVEAFENSTLGSGKARYGAEHAAQAAFHVGDLPADAPMLVLTSGLLNIGSIEEGTTRTVPVDVVAYNHAANGVRLDVLDAQGLDVRSITPPTTIMPGQTVRLLLQVHAVDLAGNASLGSKQVLVRAVSNERSSNVERLDVVVHEASPNGVPFLDPGATVLVLAAAGGSAAFFRRRL